MGSAGVDSAAGVSVMGSTLARAGPPCRARSRSAHAPPALAAVGGREPGPHVVRRSARFHEGRAPAGAAGSRSEEHTSELQSLMRISYAVFCLKKHTHKT